MTNSRGVLVIAGLWLVVLMSSAHAIAQPAPQGDPFRGRQALEQKGCLRCHSVWGVGGALGPDMAVAVTGKTWDDLVGDFWNHTPRMIDELEGLGFSWPTLDPEEMADSLSYLYYLRLFDEPGDPARGADTYSRLQCATCHTLGGLGGKTGGSLDQFGRYPSPTPLGQAMWNSGPTMQQEQARRGGAIPRFVGRELAELQAFIRAEGRRSGRDVELQPLPNPERGAAVYRAKQCSVCHDRARGPLDLSRGTLSRTASEIGGALWNHSSEMSAAMAARGVPFPRFAGNEYSDLIAHLYLGAYAGQEGDAARGAAVFADKGCAGCHKAGGTDAPDLGAVLKRTDRAGLASAMWNHGPSMRQVMSAQGLLWPKFEPGEMRDLTAYLRRTAAASQKAGGDR